MKYVSNVVVSLCFLLMSATALACQFIDQMGYDARRQFPSHAYELCELIERVNAEGVPAIVSADDDDDCDDGDPTWMPKPPYAVHVSARGVYFERIPEAAARELVDSLRYSDVRIGSLRELRRLNRYDMDRIARNLRNNYRLRELMNPSRRSHAGLYYLVVPSSRY